MALWAAWRVPWPERQREVAQMAAWPVLRLQVLPGSGLQPGRERRPEEEQKEG